MQLDIYLSSTGVGLLEGLLTSFLASCSSEYARCCEAASAAADRSSDNFAASSRSSLCTSAILHRSHR